MPCLQKFLAGLTLFFSAVFALATFEQAQVGKVRGSTSPIDSRVNGDYLLATLCYCKYDPKIADALAHYYQFEYYNIHSNTTFILTSTCPIEDYGYEVECVPSQGGSSLTGDTMKENCRAWKGYEIVHDRMKEHDDELCYTPRRHGDDDYIYFNKQKRNLSEYGGQGPTLLDEKETYKVCDGLCQEMMEIPVLRDKDYPRSRQVLWIDLADMCKFCD